MKSAFGCLANLIYFIAFAGIFLGTMMGNHCTEGPCLDDDAWKIRLMLILFGGLAIWLGAAFCFWLFEKKKADQERD